ncbi:MAG: hypothetical protein GY788_23715, partial [bacterium]|nr:hypothetical protein [bacterium]
YHDGTKWTDQVSRAGEQLEDPPDPPPPPVDAGPPPPPPAQHRPPPPVEDRLPPPPVEDRLPPPPTTGPSPAARPSLSPPADTEPLRPVGKPDAPSGVDLPQQLTEKPRGSVLRGGKKALEAENAELRAAFEEIGATEREQIRADIATLRGTRETEMQQFEMERTAARLELGRLQVDVIATSDVAILQEVGIYDFHHPLEDSAQYKDQLKAVKDQYKQAVRDKNAVVGAQDWTVNGSAAQGRKMVNDTSKLMLRA